MAAANAEIDLLFGPTTVADFADTCTFASVASFLQRPDLADLSDNKKQTKNCPREHVVPAQQQTAPNTPVPRFSSLPSRTFSFAQYAGCGTSSRGVAPSHGF